MMDSSTWCPDVLLIERGEEDSPVARRVRAALPAVRVVLCGEGRRDESTGGPEPASRDPFGAGKRRLLLHRDRGRFFSACQAGTPGLVCCDYLTLSLGSNCPYDCSYCFLQEYLSNNPVLKAVTNVSDALGEMAAVLDARPERCLRIGTGEIADSLALEPLLGHAAEIISFAATRPNVLVELKTKSDCVDGILDLDPRGRVVVSWSLAPEAVVDSEEKGAAPLGRRLRAAARCQDAGYGVGFHFDPIIDYEGCEEGYRDVIAALAATIDTRRMAWVSLGSLRTTSRLRGIIRDRHPDSRVLLAEQVPMGDGKWRVFRARRVGIYRRLAGWLREAAPEARLYLCMEAPEVWERVFGKRAPDPGSLAAELTS